MMLRRSKRPFVEDFWTRSISELFQMYNLQKWRVQVLSRHGIPNEVVLCIATTMKLHYLLRLLWPLQIWLVWFSKCCFFLSELMFSFRFVWTYLRGSDKESHKEFQEYTEILKKVCMPGEDPNHLLLANKKSMSRVKKHFTENIDKVCNWEKLITFIKPYFHPESDDHGRSDDNGRFVSQLERLPLVAEHFPALNENCMRMTALSLLNVIIVLLHLDNDVVKPKEAIEAYRQAFDLMSFIDDSDPQRPNTMDVLKVIDIEADRVSVAVYNEFKRLLKVQKKKEKAKEKFNSSEKSHNEAAPEATPKRAIEAIKKPRKEAKTELKAQNLYIGKKQNAEGEEQVGRWDQNVEKEYCDSKNWSAIAVSYSNYRVCKLVLRKGFNSEKELKKYLYESLRGVIAYCLLKLPNVLVRKCREWAVKFEEEKIWDAIFIAGKVVGVMQKSNVEVKLNFLTPNDKETQTVFA